MSPELETLDQLLGGPMPLPVIRRLYPDYRAFANGTLALLRRRTRSRSHWNSPTLIPEAAPISECGATEAT